MYENSLRHCAARHRQRDIQRGEDHAVHPEADLRAGERRQLSQGGFGKSLQQIAQLIKADVGVEVAFADIGGWDTHVNEVGGQPTNGQLANNLAQFGQALAAFYQDLGDRMEDVTLVTMSEFGRTVKRERRSRNRSRPRQRHVRAWAAMCAAARCMASGRALQEEQLYEGRDLALTTDFRDVLGELVAHGTWAIPI